MDAMRHKLMQGIIKDLMKVPVAKPGAGKGHVKPGGSGYDNYFCVERVGN